MSSVSIAADYPVLGGELRRAGIGWIARDVQGDASELLEAPASFVEHAGAGSKEDVFAASSPVEGDVDQGPQRVDVEADGFQFLGTVLHEQTCSRSV